jgi:hypothetical protein
MTEWAGERMRLKLFGACAWLAVTIALIVSVRQPTSPRSAQASAERFASTVIATALTDTDADDDPDLGGGVAASCDPVDIPIVIAIGFVVPVDIGTPREPGRPSLSSRAPPSSSI